MNNEQLQIFYAVDDSFVKYTIVSIKSMIENASKDCKYKIRILNTGISDGMKQIAYRLQNDNFEIEFVDVTSYIESIKSKLPIRDYYSKTTYFRFFIAEMFPEIKKALYIDSDTVVLGDISKLFETDLGDHYLAACNDQAVLQTPAFAEYVEYVDGISRYNFFNAGVLLINCEKFREVDVLDRFCDLLGTYSFVVAQDEDYLNVICEDNVLFLPPRWNCTVFGNLPCKEDEIVILHYIMVNKPWHYENCKMSSYFWSYAEKTEVYRQILAELASYTDEMRDRDAKSAERLLQKAIEESNRPDNYFNMLEINSKKSPERLRLLQKIEKLEREGRFDEDVEDDPPAKTLMPDSVDYMRRKFTKKIKSKVAFMLARRFLNKILKQKKMIVKEIKGIENFKNLQGGAIITCNHFNPFDSFAIQMVYEQSGQKKKFYRVIKEANYTSFPGFYGFLMRNCNTLPLSSNFDTMKEFLKSTDALLADGNFVLVYPEQSLWWNYRKPKPLKKGAFTLASRNNVPVLPCFITMEDSDIVDENGFFVQEYTIHILPPIYPDKSKSVRQNTDEMLNINYNEWKMVYEKTYGTKLTYLDNPSEICLKSAD